MQEEYAKTCSIDRMITVEDDIEHVLRGNKAATRRNGRYADVGEVFELRGVPFIVTNVYRQRISDMTDGDFKMEGYASESAYYDRILSMHGGMTKESMESATVWVHEFQPLSP
jgi:hypothetical protein